MVKQSIVQPCTHKISAFLAKKGPYFANNGHFRPLAPPAAPKGLDICWTKFLAKNGAKCWNLMGTKLDNTLFNQRNEMALLVFPKSKNFLNIYHVVVFSHYLQPSKRQKSEVFGFYSREVLLTLQSPLQHCINKHLSKMIKTFEKWKWFKLCQQREHFCNKRFYGQRKTCNNKARYDG